MFSSQRSPVVDWPPTVPTTVAIGRLAVPMLPLANRDVLPAGYSGRWERRC